MATKVAAVADEIGLYAAAHRPARSTSRRPRDFGTALGDPHGKFFGLYERHQAFRASYDLDCRPDHRVQSGGLDEGDVVITNHAYQLQ